MDWDTELWVKVYCRDTGDWLGLSFEAQAVWLLLLRKVARDGTLALGRHGKRTMAMVIGHATRWDVIEPAIDELIADGCLEVTDATATIPNFVEAQRARSSAAVRQKAWRDRNAKRNTVTEPVTPRNALRRLDETRTNDDTTAEPPLRALPTPDEEALMGPEPFDLGPAHAGSALANGLKRNRKRR